MYMKIQTFFFFNKKNEGCINTSCISQNLLMLIHCTIKNKNQGMS